MNSDIMMFVVEFHRHGVLPRGINSSFIALISKRDNPQNLGHYIPIWWVVYTKSLLANRMSKVLDKVIDPCQRAFIRGRQLLHSALVANEVVNEARSWKRKCLFFKVNFEKAYCKPHFS